MKKKFLSFALTAVVAAFAADVFALTFNEAYDSMVKNYNQRKYDETMGDVAKALPLAGNDQQKLQVLNYKFSTLNVQRKYPEAASVVEDILKLGKITEWQKNYWLNNQLAAYYNANKPDECIATCDKLLASGKVDYKDSAYYYKILAFKKKNDMNKALEAVNAYKEFSGKLKNFWNYRALLCEMQTLKDKKEYDKAVAVVSPADADGMPGNWESEYYNTLGEIYKIQKKNDEAAAAYEKAGKADNSYHGGYGWYLLGDLYATMNKDKEAVAAFMQVCDLPESNINHKVIALVRAAELLNKADKQADALEMIKKAEALTGADVNWLARGKILSGKILLQQNKTDDAKKIFEAVAATKGISADYVKQANAELAKMK